MIPRKGSLLYNHIADNIRRYSLAISLYKKELEKDLSPEDAAYYTIRINESQKDLDEMIDVIQFMDRRYELLSGTRTSKDEATRNEKESQ